MEGGSLVQSAQPHQPKRGAARDCGDVETNQRAFNVSTWRSSGRGKVVWEEVREGNFSRLESSKRNEAA